MFIELGVFIDVVGRTTDRVFKETLYGKVDKPEILTGYIEPNHDEKISISLFGKKVVARIEDNKQDHKRNHNCTDKDVITI